MLRREPGDDLVLGQAQVLELVHQDGIPARPDRRRLPRVPSEQLAGESDEVVVVEQVAGAERFAIRVGRARCRRRVSGNVLQPVAAEEAEELGLTLRPYPEPAEHPLLVVLVGQTEAPTQAHERRVLAQEREAQRVEGTAGDFVGRRPRASRRSRSAISSAALLVKVTAQIRAGGMPSRRMRWPIRPIRQKVLPGPRPSDDQDGAGRGFDGAALSRGRRRPSPEGGGGVDSGCGGHRPKILRRRDFSRPDRSPER